MLSRGWFVVRVDRKCADSVWQYVREGVSEVLGASHHIRPSRFYSKTTDVASEKPRDFPSTPFYFLLPSFSIPIFLLPPPSRFARPTQPASKNGCHRKILRERRSPHRRRPLDHRPLRQRGEIGSGPDERHR